MAIQCAFNLLNRKHHLVGTKCFKLSLIWPSLVLGIIERGIIVIRFRSCAGFLQAVLPVKLRYRSAKGKHCQRTARKLIEMLRSAVVEAAFNNPSFYTVYDENPA